MMNLDPKEKLDVSGKEEWHKHPEYLADMGGLCGAPPELKCQYCEKKDYELFYGHCKKCAVEKNIPRNTAEPEEFHKAVEEGEPTVVKGPPQHFFPWWHWHRWFPRKY